ncbi:hypothetical protein DPEC_G00076320 [Dallia pectoralis]|uniref:Uncharacterized protein n=1 Tax=Dallia pectoralis TaxID=75939 RepID=A0ACC2H460_DALPE|nr:hypothetical protein DPEC_G00076320 [Dallia pectoralis]
MPVSEIKNRLFLNSSWGWTCVFTGSFVFLFSFSIRRSLGLSLRHVSRMGITGALWWGLRHLLTVLEDAAGSCYEPIPANLNGGQGASVPGKSLLVCCTKTRAKPPV